VTEHLLTHPGGRGDQLAGGTLLNKAQILFNGAVCIGVHLHGLQIAANQWHQTGKNVGLWRAETRWRKLSSIPVFINVYMTLTLPLKISLMDSSWNSSLNLAC